MFRYNFSQTFYIVLQNLWLVLASIQKNSNLEIVVVKRKYLIRRGEEEFHVELHRLLMQRVHIELTQYLLGIFC